MTRNRQNTSTSRSPLVGLAFVLLAFLSPALTGCVEGSVFLGTVSSPTNTDEAETRKSLIQFADVFRTYAKAGTGTPRRIHHFNDALSRIHESYVTPVNDRALVEAAIEGIRTLDGAPGTFDSADVVEAAMDSLMATLDPHSSYLTSEELKENTVSTRGEFGGLGIEVIVEDGLIKVVSPIEDTPAFHAGLKSGDKITHLDGVAIKGKPLMESIRIMRGEPGSPIGLTILREGVEPFDVTIVRAIISVRSVRWRSHGDIGYVRVVNFSQKVAPGIEAAMSALKDELGPRMAGVVLDLRSNPGGLLNQSLELTDAFLSDGVIVSVRGRDAFDERIYRADGGDMARGLPMVVLINGGSASASEIVAGALQDHRRAVVMGTPSFGKGSVQTIMPLPLEGALRLTTQLYYVPSDRSIQGAGIVPDIHIRPKEEVKGRREADLPHAISNGVANGNGNGETPPPNETPDDALSGAEAEIDEATCPVIKVRERDDRVLGCALSYLKAGSTAHFLAAIESGGAL